MVTMPEITYILRFVHRSGDVELFEHADRELAFSHFNSFDESDADIYCSIELIERNWEPFADTLLETKTFGGANHA